MGKLKPPTASQLLLVSFCVLVEDVCCHIKYVYMNYH